MGAMRAKRLIAAIAATAMATSALLAITDVVAGAAKGGKGPTFTHELTTQAIVGGHRLSSTVTGATTGVVEWQFLQQGSPDNALGSSDRASLTKRQSSVTSVHEVSCAAGSGGTWQVHVQVHSGPTGSGPLVFSDTATVTLTC